MKTVPIDSSNVVEVLAVRVAGRWLREAEHLLEHGMQPEPLHVCGELMAQRAASAVHQSGEIGSCFLAALNSEPAVLNRIKHRAIAVVNVTVMFGKHPLTALYLRIPPVANEPDPVVPSPFQLLTLLNKAKELLRQALDGTRHTTDPEKLLHKTSCGLSKFRHENRCLPPTHPAWAYAPACTCWVGPAQDFLKGA